jgi:DNA-binding transcriptional ArsR family regulator
MVLIIWGNAFPRTIPPAMQRATQRVRYLSKRLRDFALAPMLFPIESGVPSLMMFRQPRIEGKLDFMVFLYIAKCQYEEEGMPLRKYERVLKSAADPTRVRILKILEGGEICVCQIIAILGLSQSTISKHLFLLKMSGLVKERREGRWVHYSLDGSGGSPYARKVLQTLKGWLNDDPVIVQDRKRGAFARKIGPEAVCHRGMTLPARIAGACFPPAKRAAAT